MTIEEVVAELLAAPLRDFTSRRGAQARELKTGGQPDLAGQVSALKKPPVALWAADQVARRDRAALDRLRRAGQAVVDAQAAAAGGRGHAAPALRQASSALRAELDSAVRTAADALREGGHAADEATRRRVQEILRVAAVSGGESWEQLRRGSLLTEPRAGEDMLTAAFASTLAPSPGSPPSSTLPRPTGGPSTRSAARDAQRANKRLEAEHAARTAKMDAERAREASDTARRLREQATTMTADARRAVTRARDAERDAERAAARARVSDAAARRLSRR